MASPRKRLPTNVPGDFFVDSTCIDCDTCRWMAPGIFDRVDGASRVHRQPDTPALVLEGMKALVSCPTGSIGTAAKHPVRPVFEALPAPIAGGIYHCGYHHEASFGATSYLIVRERGNVLVDSPRFARPLVQALERLGGVSLMFLTHRDDVADHEAFARHFGCPRLMHADDVTAATEGIELTQRGAEPDALDDELTLIPVPGHTKGSVCLLYRGDYLFTGDHMAWDDEAGALEAWPGVCWYSWPQQVASTRRLAGFDFEWVLPGHGRRVQLPRARMREEMGRLIGWMESVGAA